MQTQSSIRSSWVEQAGRGGGGICAVNEVHRSVSGGRALACKDALHGAMTPERAVPGDAGSILNGLLWLARVGPMSIANGTRHPLQPLKANAKHPHL